MIRTCDGISFGTVSRRRRAPVELFLGLEVYVPVGGSLEVLSAMLAAAQRVRQHCRFAERNAGSLIGEVCKRLR